MARSRKAAVAACVLLVLGAVGSVGAAKGPQLAYVIELDLSDSYDIRDTRHNDAREAYREFDYGSGVYRISIDEGADARVAVSTCSLYGEYLYTDEGLWLSHRDHYEPFGHCGSIRIRLYFKDLNTSGIRFPGNTTNLFIGGIMAEFEEHSAWGWPAAGVHLTTSRGTDWNSYIPLTGSGGYCAVDFQTRKYFVGRRMDINIDPTAQLLGVDGFAIQSCVWSEILLKRIWIYVFYNVT